MTHNAARLLTMYRHQLTQTTIRDLGRRPAISQGRFFGLARDGHARSRLGISILTTRSERDSGAALNASSVMAGARLASEHNCARCSATPALPVAAGRPHPDRRCLRVPLVRGWLRISSRMVRTACNTASPSLDIDRKVENFRAARRDDCGEPRWLLEMWYPRAHFGQARQRQAISRTRRPLSECVRIEVSWWVREVSHRNGADEGSS